MFFFFLSCFSFLLVYKSISFKPFLPSITIMKLLSSHLWVEQSSSLVSCIRKMRITLGNFGVTFISPLMSKPADLETESKKEMVEEAMSLLDLPELALECILERLSPAELCSMAGVCTYLKEKCRSDHLWEKHMKQKWGRVIPNTGSRDWQWQIALNQRMRLLGKSKDHGFCRSLSSVWPLSLIFPKSKGRSKGRDFLPPHSTMAWYLSLESGKIWFPAQVYNRENGHDGFMLSCYDAELSYNSETDTFQARYSPHGRLTMEENISWDRLRAPPVDTPQYLLHVSDCLDDLKPGDHFEIQWRRNKEYPYGWWYGVVGHLDSCTGNNCSCYSSDMVVLEFNQYAQESRWRRTIISRKTHHEEGNEGDGFYGGIRKLYGAEEISTWKSMWPNRLLD